MPPRFLKESLSKIAPELTLVFQDYTQGRVPSSTLSSLQTSRRATAQLLQIAGQ
ncbi:hypothetical protein DPMN_110585 [Dreissena polymorpha]|uniref:Uncharacterized protein n=1 Tax=Dreissena polymorpha TaxID=45954 RepID=A0A9D4KCV6_DREPO|nr:hypothetical protein DPMN_110585 [Dreissena polymorpha]